MRRYLLLVFACLLATAGLAKGLATDAVRMSVSYPGGDSRDVLVTLQNIIVQVLELSYDSYDVSITSPAGVPVLPMALVDPVGYTIKLPARGWKTINVSPWMGGHFLLPGEAYLVTFTVHANGEKETFSCTFPYMMPVANPTFTSEWTEVKEQPGLRVRLLVTLNPGERSGESRMEYLNAGVAGTGVVYDRAMLNAEVRHLPGGTLLEPDGQVAVRMRAPNIIRLPGFATLGLPLSQYGGADAIPTDRISLWLGYNQYLLRRGERYRITATTFLPADGEGAAGEAALKSFELTVPGVETVPVKNDAPVIVSVRYAQQPATPATPLQVCFTNTLAHPLTFTGDVLAAVDRYGRVPIMTTSGRAPGLWLPRDTKVPAGGMQAFNFTPHHFTFSPGEAYFVTGRWKLRDEVTKQEYTVTATFPYLAPAEFPTCTGAWMAVKERPGLELRLRTALCPSLRRIGVLTTWQPSSWLEYRNTGNKFVRLFDYPTLEFTLKNGKGQEVGGSHFKRTGIPKIEELLLPTGASLTLAAVHNELYLEKPPQDARHALCFDHLIFPLLSGEHYTLEGTVLLPGEETGKGIAAPFAPVQIMTPTLPKGEGAK